MEGISTILLAAGESTRMGSLKALLPWQDLTLVGYQIQSLQRAGVSQVVLVVGHRGAEVEAPVRGKLGVKVVANPYYRQGKTTSVKTGLQHLSSSTQGILVLAVDQPRPPHILEALINAHLEVGALITCPVYHGHTGHPLIFASSLLPELAAITEEGQGLREVTRRHSEETYRMEMDSPIVTVDINSQEYLRQAQKLFDGSQ